MQRQTRRDRRDKRPVEPNLFRNVSPLSFSLSLSVFLSCFCVVHVGSRTGVERGNGQASKVNKNAQKRMDRKKVASLVWRRVNKASGLGVATP